MMRVRDRSRGSTTTKTGVERSSTGSVVGPITMGKVTNGHLDRIIDRTGPEYRKAIKSGGVIMNPYSRTKVFVSSFGNGYSGRQGTTTYTFDGEHSLSLCPKDVSGLPLPGGSPIDSVEVDNLITMVSTDAWAGVTDGDANFVESLAEAESVIQMVRSPFTTLSKVWKGISNLNSIPNGWGQALKSFQKKAAQNPGQIAKKGLGNVANGWLLYRYGIQPLVADIQAAMNAANTVTTERRKSRSNGSLSRTNTTSSRWSAGVYSGSCTVQVDEEILVKALVVYDETRGIASRLGLTTRNLVTVPWELLTLSFVADWFANVGSFLNSIAPKGGVQHLGSCVTVVRRKTTTYTYVGDSIAPGWELLMGINGTIVRVDESIVRSVPAPKPGLALRWSDKKWSLNRQLDGAALLLGKFTQLWQPQPLPKNTLTKGTVRKIRSTRYF